MPTETVQLAEHHAELIRSYVENGRFSSVSEAVSAGLQLLEQRESEDREKLECLRAEVQKGLDDLEAGRYTEIDSEGIEAYLDTVRARGRARLLEEGRNDTPIAAQQGS